MGRVFFLAPARLERERERAGRKTRRAFFPQKNPYLTRKDSEDVASEGAPYASLVSMGSLPGKGEGREEGVMR